MALCAVFVLAAAFYLWTTGTTVPLSLHGGEADPYNQLADAFLHLRLSVGRPPAGLLALRDPYNPERNVAFQGLTSVLNLGIHDFSLFHRKLFLTWGPAPAVVLLVPMHLLGFAPTASLTVSIFAIAGLGFALATLRAILRQIGEVPLWMCVLAALTLALASTVPFVLRRPAIYEEEICGGYCFVMAAIWLAMSALARRQASLRRLALMSLCFGLAIGSRPTLAFTAVLLVLVFLSLRKVRPRRGLLISLAAPLGTCALLLLAYNQVRFGSPLENGTHYQLAGVNQYAAHFERLSYVPPGLWFYWASPPRGAVVFPFIFLTPPPLSYPGSLPGLYPGAIEQTGGLLPMAPIVVFLVALPWIWRRRPTSLEWLAAPLLALAAAGMAGVLFLSYVFFSTTERYEVDFTTLFLIGALAAWLAVAQDASGWSRRMVRAGGGLLAVWSCVGGLAISFTGYYNLLALDHPGTWQLLQEIGSPLSRAIVAVEGHPVLAEVAAKHLPLLEVGEPESLTIISPDAREAELLASVRTMKLVKTAPEPASYPAVMAVRGPGGTSSIYHVSSGGEPVQIPVSLRPGSNHLTLTPLAVEGGGNKVTVPASEQLLLVKHLSLQSGN
ncbi:MAG: hypothetical protein ABR992_02405 [Solirubrobacteraceae bacterium]